MTYIGRKSGRVTKNGLFSRRTCLFRQSPPAITRTARRTNKGTPVRMTAFFTVNPLASYGRTIVCPSPFRGLRGRPYSHKAPGYTRSLHSQQHLCVRNFYGIADSRCVSAVCDLEVLGGLLHGEFSIVYALLGHNRFRYACCTSSKMLCFSVSSFARAIATFAFASST